MPPSPDRKQPLPLWYGVSADMLQSLYKMLSRHQSLGVVLPDTEPRPFDIEHVQESESAWVLFVQSPDKTKQFVFKLLRDYQDTRYQQSSIKERQNCQLEALAWNRIFSPHNYYGLARICDFDVEQKRIILDPIISHPDPQELYQTSDYVLAMRKLPQESSLISLLQREDEQSLQHHIQLLIQRIAQIHTNLAALSSEESHKWGSLRQLQEKLYHNFSLADPVLSIGEVTRPSYLEPFRETFLSLKNTFDQKFIWDSYAGYFQQRIENNCIKRCHGDLKAPNIWIESGNTSDEKNISILDAIDFNPMYCNIDTLSDFGTLVVDIQARTGSIDLAVSMIEQYLRETNQQDQTSRTLLNYYLFEKAFVGATISIVYDASRDSNTASPDPASLELGTSYLQVATLRLNALLGLTPSPRVEPPM
jgi:aminoglycoside phosphotransferase family enzyme